MGTLVKTHDRYVTRLNDFSFHTTEVLDQTALHFSVSAVFGIIRYMQAGFGFQNMDSGSFRERESRRSFDWSSLSLGVFLRGRLPLASDLVAPYLQAGVDAAWGRTKIVNEADSGEDTAAAEDGETYWRYYVSGGGGVQLVPWSFLGFLLHVDYSYAPLISNLIGDEHNSGGVAVFTGLRGGF